MKIVASKMVSTLTPKNMEEHLYVLHQKLINKELPLQKPGFEVFQCQKKLSLWSCTLTNVNGLCKQSLSARQTALCNQNVLSNWGHSECKEEGIQGCHRKEVRKGQGQWWDPVIFKWNVSIVPYEIRSGPELGCASPTCAHFPEELPAPSCTLTLCVFSK